MLLTSAQQTLFWRKWAECCRKRGWTRADGFEQREIDALRKDLLRACGFQSLTEVDKTAGFSKVLAKIGVWQGESVRAAIEDGDPSLNEARILRHTIRTEILPCLALYTGDAEAYFASIFETIVHWRKDGATQPVTLDDLDARPRFKEGKPSPSQLQQALMTLSARLNAKRNEAGHTIHQMKTLAGVACDCAACRAPQPEAVEISVEQPF